MRRVTTILLLGLLIAAPDLQAAEARPISFELPKPHQVVQRVGYDPLLAAKEKPGHPSYGYADVELRAKFVIPKAELIWEYHVTLLEGASGRAVEWSPLHVQVQDGSLCAKARVPAGGWYRLDVRASDKGTVAYRGSIEPIGVGEVFVVAGQSYATNCNDEKLKVADPQGRVVAYDSADGSWKVAHDPQPVADGSKDGSIWPPIGDALLKEFHVPIAFANVAIGGTSSSQWLPERAIHQRLVKTGRNLGRFRCVVWQQGESDVIAKTTTANYVENVRKIRNGAASAWNWEPSWILAKSTLHPTVYNDAVGEGRIRKAIDELTNIQGFLPGPDTDKLSGENRGDAKSRRHFSAVGQRRAAEMWVAVLKPYLRAPQPLREKLADLNLLNPAWASAVIHRESSVLLRLNPKEPARARLAFPASEIIEVVGAGHQHRFVNGRDFVLSNDGLQLIFRHHEPLAVIAATDMFVPKGSPNSYSHRVGHPEQFLLYRPGRWFHDRDIEVTYRRADKPTTLKTFGALPKTLALLKTGNKLTLGISGDSISTGLDASGTTKSFPFQPGFPDLVAAQLRVTFRADVVLNNRAISGWSVANGVADLPKLLESKPDLIVVAYGMNDVGRKDPKWFGEQTRAIVDRIHKDLPTTEIILVAPMLGNVEWVHTPRDMFAKYRDELKALCGNGIALADLTAVWDLLLKNKHDFDLTGNGLNHPNDFGHRLYAQAILELLTERVEKPSAK